MTQRLVNLLWSSDYNGLSMDEWLELRKLLNLKLLEVDNYLKLHNER